MIESTDDWLSVRQSSELSLSEFASLNLCISPAVHSTMPNKVEPFGLDDEHYLGLCFVVTCALQLSCFAVAYTCEFDLITDFAGSTNFVLLGVSDHECTSVLHA